MESAQNAWDYDVNLGDCGIHQYQSCLCSKLSNIQL